MKMSILDNLKGIKDKIESADIKAVTGKIQNGVGKVGNFVDSITRTKKKTDELINESNKPNVSQTKDETISTDIIEQTNNTEVSSSQTNKLFDGNLSEQEASVATAVLFTQTAALIATQYKDYKTQALNIKKELEEIKLRNENNLEIMKQAYQQRKPMIDQILKGLDEQQQQLNYYKEKELSEEEHKTYQFLLVAITKQIDSLVHLYDSIMG